MLRDHRRRLRELISDPVALSYSLPGFGPAAWRDAPAWLLKLCELGFRSVTLHPTWAVSDGPEPLIDFHSAPDCAPVVEEAHRLGLVVRLEPHLDWLQTLTGGPYEWRRRMYLNPGGGYFERILEPLAELGPDELTLGSELDVSAYEFGDMWAACAAELKDTGIALGHKLNHDWESARSAVRSVGNAERRKRGKMPRLPFGYATALEAYLGILDYVAVSFYQAEEWRLPGRFTIGEFGLGSTDVSRPWHFDASTFRTPEDFAIRREWYLQFLEWLGTRRGRAACFWTAGHFDVLGVMHPEWRDDSVVEAVRLYNQDSP